MDNVAAFDRIIDAAARLSRLTRLAQEERTARREAALIGTRCGECDKWMKSRECPREKNVNGRSKGPSMNDPVCSAFVLKDSSAKHRAELLADADRLRAALDGREGRKDARRICTCTGTCKGAGGLGAGWRCALDGREGGGT